MRFWLGAIAAALLGCASEEQLDAVATDGGATTDAGPIDDGGAGGGGGLDAGPPKRTVTQRNPFGNVAETENLLWDGDFEWYSPFSDQYGWLAGNSASSLSYSLPEIKIGAACRSGMRCVLLKKKRVIAGLAVASRDNKLAVSLWAHVAAGTCDKVAAVLTNFDGQNEPDVDIQPVKMEPGADGWCRYESLVDARKGKPVLFIQNNTDGEVIIDDTVIKRVPAAMTVKAYHGPPTAELAADLADARASFHRLRGPHDPPRNPARRAYEQWRQP